MDELGDESHIVWATSSHPFHDKMVLIGPPFLRDFAVTNTSGFARQMLKSLQHPNNR